MNQIVPNLGELCDDAARRDAVHVAVAPVTAGQQLEPGDHVGLVGGVAVTAWHRDDFHVIGVVDPFLTTSVDRGQRFWLLLYPNTVTSLRHVWTHPAFKSRIAEVAP